MKIDLQKLEEKGWILVDGISTKRDLLELGKTIGTPVRTPNGELIKEIRRLPIDKAPLGSQSSLYGTGSFPLHTDTVFWPLPVKYVLLRGYGDTRRPTTVAVFTELIKNYDKKFQNYIKKSIWFVNVGNKKFYCSCNFSEGSCMGWRYDADLMFPVNKEATYVNKILNQIVRNKASDNIAWSGDQAAIISNWNVLHGRGERPPNEGIRIIERLYVR